MIAALLTLLALNLQDLPTEQAPNIVGAWTEDIVEIRSDFAGADLIVFGVAQGLRVSDDIVVAVRGPGAELRVMRKQRVFGVWVNRAPVRFNDIPGYYAVASTRPLSDFADPGALARQGIGLANIAAASGEAGMTAEYINAISRARAREALYAESPAGVRVLDAGLFQAAVNLPPETPVGDYVAEVYLFRGGRPVASRTTTLRVEKAGLERAVYAFAHEYPAFYGLWAVAIAAFAGWLAAWLFGRR